MGKAMTGTAPCALGRSSLLPVLDIGSPRFVAPRSVGPAPAPRAPSLPRLNPAISISAAFGPGSLPSPFLQSGPAIMKQRFVYIASARQLVRSQCQ